MTKIIRVLACCDDKFQRSAWHFDIKKEITTSLDYLHDQFPEAIFELTRISNWNSPGIEELTLYPEKIVRTLDGDVDTFMYQVMKEIKALELPFTDKDYLEQENDLNEVLKKVKSGECPIEYFLGFLAGRFDCWLHSSMTAQLKRHFPITKEFDVVIGFTGKVFRFNCKEISQLALGWAKKNSLFTDEAYVIIGTWLGGNVSPVQVIIHELGHILGASHSLSKKSVMFESALNHSIIFDRSNAIVIRKKIMGH